MAFAFEKLIVYQKSVGVADKITVTAPAAGVGRRSLSNALSGSSAAPWAPANAGENPSPEGPLKVLRPR